jgi:hypothetical protein
MQNCYHKECDSATNQDIKSKESMEFLQLTAQALVLTVADLSEGLEGCNLDPIINYIEDDDPVRDVDEQFTLSGVGPHASLDHSLSFYGLLLTKLRENLASQSVGETLEALWKSLANAAPQKVAAAASVTEDHPRQFHGPYQPNYGTQINIGQVSLAEGFLKPTPTPLTTTTITTTTTTTEIYPDRDYIFIPSESERIDNRYFSGDHRYNHYPVEHIMKFGNKYRNNFDYQRQSRMRNSPMIVRLTGGDGI